MNGDLTPAVVAATGGSAMLAGIWLHERRRTEAMRGDRIRLALRFPIGVEPSQALAALDGLSGLPLRPSLLSRLWPVRARSRIFCGCQRRFGRLCCSTMTGVIPSLRVTEAPPSPDEAVTLALRLFIPTPERALG